MAAAFPPLHKCIDWGHKQLYFSPFKKHEIKQLIWGIVDLWQWPVQILSMFEPILRLTKKGIKLGSEQFTLLILNDMYR